MAVIVANNMRVVIDGHDISHHVRSLEMEAPADGLVVTRLELLGGVTISPEGVVTIAGFAGLEPPEAPGDSNLVVRALTLGQRQVAPSGLPMGGEE